MSVCSKSALACFCQKFATAWPYSTPWSPRLLEEKITRARNNHLVCLKSWEKKNRERERDVRRLCEDFPLQDMALVLTV